MVRAFTALIAIVVGVLAPSPAMAEDPVWHRATCFSGVIDSVEVTEHDRAFLTLTGHLDCGTSDKLATFGYAKYEAESAHGGRMSVSDLRRYRNTAPTPFVEGRYVRDGPVSFMICVVTDYDMPVDCVQVDRPDWGQKLQVNRFLKDDSPDGRDVYFVDPDYRPACGGCW